MDTQEPGALVGVGAEVVVLEGAEEVVVEPGLVVEVAPLVVVVVVTLLVVVGTGLPPLRPWTRLATADW